MAADDNDGAMPPLGQSARVQSKDRGLGAELRRVYQKTVEETVPTEMLDLLGKLD